MNLYFIRHLKTEWNAEGRIQGTLNSNLLLDTNKLEKNIADYLRIKKINTIYFSPLKRCIDTLDLISCLYKLEHKISDNRLRELNHGKYEGRFLKELSTSEKEAKTNNPWYWEWPEGESYYQLSLRVKSFLNHLKKFEEGKNIAILSHEGVIKVFIKELINLKLEKFINMKVPNNVIYSIENKSLKLTCLNEISNLILTKL